MSRNLLMPFVLMLALAGCGDRSGADQSVSAGIHGEASAIMAVVSHLRETGSLPGEGWFVLDRLIVGEHGPLLIDPRSFEARAAELTDSIMTGLREYRVRACGVRGGNVCAEGKQGPVSSIVSIGPAEAGEAPDCASPWWVGIVSLDTVPREEYSSVLFLSCLEEDAHGAWQVTEMDQRASEN